MQRTKIFFQFYLLYEHHKEQSSFEDVVYALVRSTQRLKDRCFIILGFSFFLIFTSVFR